MSDQPWKEIRGTIRIKRRDLYRHACGRWYFRAYRRYLRNARDLIAKELAKRLVEQLRQKTQQVTE